MTDASDADAGDDSDGGDDQSETQGGTARCPDDVALLLDVMLGKLAVYLRMCGYDAAYAGDRDVEADERLLEIADAEDRILLTRDVRLAGRAADAVLLSERAVQDQLEEMRDVGFALALAEPPSRCGRCNGRLESVPGGAETPEYAPEPAETDCWRCRSCGQVFWEGSHRDRVAETLEML